MFKLADINRFIIIVIAIAFRYVALFYSSTYLNYALIIVLFLLTILNIFKVNFPKNKFFVMIWLLLFSVVIFIVYKEDNLFIYYVTALAFLNDTDSKVIEKFLIISIFFFVLIIISGKIGIIDIVEGRRYIDGKTVYRNSLGFGNINTPFIYYMGIVFGIYYFLHNNKFKLLLAYIITTLIALYMFIETDCRTGFYMYLLFIISSFFYNKKINDKVKSVVPYVFILFTIFSLFLAIICGTTINNPINVLLSNRPYFSYYYIKNNLLFSLLGTGTVTHYVLDNYYLSLLVKSGIVGYLTYLYIFTKGSNYLKDNYCYVLIILFTLIYGISECSLYGNFIFIILLKNMIKPSNEVLNNEKD